MKEATAYRTGQSLAAFRGLEVLVGRSVSEPALRKPLEAGLVEILGPSSSLEAKRLACEQLGIVGGNAALPALARLLAGEETAGIACLALTTYPPGKADEILREALASFSVTVRIQVITALGDRQDARAVRVLAQRAEDAELGVAQAAIAALGKIGDEPARKAIAALRGEARPGLEPALTEAALRCAERLGASGDRRRAIAAYEELLDASPAGYVRRAALEALLRLDVERRQERILATLRGMDSTLKPAAIAAVRTLPAGVSSEPFVAEMYDLTPAEQVWMIDSLAGRNDLGARLAICLSVSSPNKTVRLAAIQALSRVGDASLASMFAGALNSAKTAQESRAIETALADLRGGAATDKAITAQLKRCGGKARAGFIAALARRVGPAANPVFFGEIENKDPAVASAAFRALAKTAQESDVPALVEALVNLHDRDVRPDAENAAAQGLARIPSAASRSALVRSALGRARTAASRRSLLGLLPGCADARALEALKTAVADPDPRIRDAAVRALADWPDAAAWDTLAGVCHEPGDETAHGLALGGLIRLALEASAHPDGALIERYRELVAGARTEAQLKLVLGALAGVAHPDALSLATGLLTRPEVRAEAQAAVRKIAEAIQGQYPEAAQKALRQIQPAK